MRSQWTQRVFFGIIETALTVNGEAGPLTIAAPSSTSIFIIPRNCSVNIAWLLSCLHFAILCIAACHTVHCSALVRVCVLTEYRPAYRDVRDTSKQAPLSNIDCLANEAQPACRLPPSSFSFFPQYPAIPLTCMLIAIESNKRRKTLTPSTRPLNKLWNRWKIAVG